MELVLTFLKTVLLPRLRWSHITSCPTARYIGEILTYLQVASTSVQGRFHHSELLNSELSHVR